MLGSEEIGQKRLSSADMSAAMLDVEAFVVMENLS
jgi:hypothetical protein